MHPLQPNAPEAAVVREHRLGEPGDLERRRSRVSLRAALGLILLWAAIEIFAAPTLVLAGWASEFSVAYLIGKLASASAVASFAVLTLGGPQRGPARRAVGLAGAQKRSCGLGLGLGIGTAAAQVALGLAFADVGPGVETVYTGRSLEGLGALSLLAPLSFALLTPFVEEFLFRGHLFAAFRYRWGEAVAAVSTSMLFLTAHLVHMPSLPLLVPLIAFAVLITVLRVHSGSLLPGLLAHVAFNGSLVPLLFAG